MVNGRINNYFEVKSGYDTRLYNNVKNISKQNFTRIMETDKIYWLENSVQDNRSEKLEKLLNNY
jgi:hypothetical protein